ncbi:YbaK/EbsC family protein [Lactococcus garvieae]|uniref:YbaK/EbsC family protein n=1 Tax=Lactococcus garvieae TaxID=1363 RepID=UPI0009BD7EA8|nr:YbaK/EbsC family protein [Lactococcus garvieae]
MLDLKKILEENNIYFEVYHHHAIYTNEDAVLMKEEYGFQGTETKSLFLKDKQGKHLIYFTFTTKRTDFKALKKLVGKKLSVVVAEEMESLTGQKAGAVSPFGYEEEVPVIIDKELLLQEKLVFAPGRPDQTMVIKSSQLFDILHLLKIEYYIFDSEEEAVG